MSMTQLLSTFDVYMALLILFAYMAIDGMYALYTIKVIDKKPYSAASIGTLIHVLVAFGIINYINNILYLVPLMLGSWVGTFLVVRYNSRKNI